YDSLNREVMITYADGKTQAVAYDVHDNLVTRRDANGTVCAMKYDLLNRRTRVDVTPGTDVSKATTFENYEYDGLSRLVRAEDDDSVVTRGYDSFSRVIRETLNGQATSATYDGVGNLLRSVYPGGRVIVAEYDE